MSTLDQLERFSVKEVMQFPLGDEVNWSFPLSKDLAPLFAGSDGFTGIIEIGVTHIDQGVQVVTRIEARGTVLCSRCTRDTDVTIDESLAATYARQADFGDYMVTPQLIINLVQQCIDTVIPAIPDRVLCQPNCQGMCRECGQNLNDDPSHFSAHPTHRTDDRLLGNSMRMK